MSWAGKPGGSFGVRRGIVNGLECDQPHNNLQPYLTCYFCIALQGVFPLADIDALEPGEG